MSASRIWVGGYTADMSGMAEGIGLLKVQPDGQLTNSVVSFRIGDDGIPQKVSSVAVPSPTYLLLA